MAIIDLKSDLSQIRVKVKRNLTDTTLPRPNMRDASGNIEIKYDDIIDKTEKNKKYVNDTNNWKSTYDSKKY